MPERRSILIGCPHYRRCVRGSYECDGQGNFLVDSAGRFLLHRVRCGHNGGRCTQTLCVLHRYNRLGQGSWHPAGIWAAPAGGDRCQEPAPAGRAREGEGWYA